MPAAVFCAGCWFGLQDFSLHLYGILLFCLLNACLYAAGRLSRRCSAGMLYVPLLAVIFLTGAARGRLYADASGPSGSIEDVAEGSPVTVRGVVDSDVELVSDGARRRAFFDMICDDGRSVRVSLKPGRGNLPVYGDEVSVTGYGRSFPGGKVSMHAWRLFRNSSGQDGGLRRRLYSMRAAAGRMLEAGVEDYPREVSVMKALVLGYRRGVDRETRDAFVSAGSLHIFAISGLHVGIICGFAVFALRVSRIAPVYWFPWLALFLAGYTAATGASSSAVRACVMALVYFFGIMAGRRPDLFSSIAFTALVLVGWSPSYLADTGFVLSFAVAAGIAVLGAPLMRLASLSSSPDSFAAGAGMVRRSCILEWIKGTAAVSAAAWLSSAPLMLFYFGRLSLSGIICSILVVPLAFFVVLSGCCSIVFGQVSASVSSVFNHASAGLVKTLRIVVDVFAGIPFTELKGVEFGVCQVLEYYLLLALFAVLINHKIGSWRDSPGMSPL